MNGMNRGGFNSGTRPRFRYRRREVQLKGIPMAPAALDELIDACARTGHAEDAMLLRTVASHQRRYAEDLQRHTDIECLVSDLVQALNAGQAAQAEELQGLLVRLGAAVERHPDGAVEWLNPVFTEAAGVTEGPITHDLSGRAHVETDLR